MNLPVFDLHCDTALELLDSQCRPVERLKQRRGHIDLERAGSCRPMPSSLPFYHPDMDATGRFSPEMIFDAMLSNLQRGAAGEPGSNPSGQDSGGDPPGGGRRKNCRSVFPWRALQALALTRAGWKSWRLWDSV